MILQEIKKINQNNISHCIHFLAMGGTALAGSLIAHQYGVTGSIPCAIMGTMASTLCLFQLTSERLIKKRLSRFIIKEPIPSFPSFSFYKNSFKDWFYQYLADSPSHVERKYKAIFTSLALKTLDIEPHIVFKDPMEEGHWLSIKYHIYDNGKNANVFDTFVNYLSISDIEDKENLRVAKKIYEDFQDLGILGKTVARCFGLSTTATFINALQCYQLNEKDIAHIIEETHKLKQIPVDKLQGNMAASGSEKDFIFSIIENNPHYIKELREFYCIRHTRKIDGKIVQDFPELMDYLQRSEASYNMHQTLQQSLPPKEITAQKIKKI